MSKLLDLFRTEPVRIRAAVSSLIIALAAVVAIFGFNIDPAPIVAAWVSLATLIQIMAESMRGQVVPVDKAQTVVNAALIADPSTVVTTAPFDIKGAQIPVIKPPEVKAAARIPA